MSQSTVGNAGSDALALEIAADNGPALPAQEIVTGRGLAAGTSGAGKSNTATVVAEEVLDLGIPLAVLDPEGEFVALNEEYPVVVFGTEPTADIRGDSDDARSLARRAVAESVPVVFDLSGFGEDETHIIAGAVANGLFNAELAHESPFLLIADELDEFLPNKKKTAATKPLSRVAQRGRKRGLGFLGVSQRPANISKNFVTQAEYHLWHRLKWDSDQATAKDHLADGYGDDLEFFDDGEVILGADWEDQPRQFYVRLKTVTDLGSTPSIQRSLGSVPSEVPESILGTPDEDAEDEDEGEETKSAAENCSDCPFCAAGVEPPADLTAAATAADGDVLAVYKVCEMGNNGHRVETRGNFLEDLGLEAGDTVSVGVEDGDVRLFLDDSGLVEYQVGEGRRYLRVILSGRGVELLAADPGDHVRIVERDGRVILERVTGRSDALDYPILARKEPYCRSGSDRAANVMMPKSVTDYLGMDERIGVRHVDGDVLLVPADESDLTYTITDGSVATVGAKALQPLEATAGDTIVATPAGPRAVRLTVQRGAE